MATLRWISIIVACLACLPAQATNTLTLVEQRAWLDYLLPLPQEIEITQVISAPPGAIQVRATEGSGEIARNAAAMLARYSQATTGTLQNPAFRIVLGLADAEGRLEGVGIREFKRLATLPNRQQAYVIQPEGANALYLTALDERGLFHGAATLIQLLTSAPAKKGNVLPLVQVLDWPDFDERGIWNNPEPDAWIEWLPSLKLNYSNMWTNEIQPIRRGEKGRFKISAEAWQRARRMAFNYAPQIVHLNFLHQYGLFIAYPELAGEGDGALAGRYLAHGEGNPHRAPKPNHPELARLLSEWMLDIAAQGADEAVGWLSERPAEDESADTAAVGQFVLEARAFVEAWRIVRQTHPDFKLRLFLSTTTEERDYRVYHETPPEVKLVRCCATPFERVTMLPRDRFMNTSLDPHARAGRWAESYDVPLPGYGKVENPIYMIPHSSPHRVRDFVAQLHERGYSGAVGRCWDTCDVNLHALAEWSWNLDGRTEGEFMRAWATRKGYADPEAVAKWAEIMGPIEWDVYDSDFPECYSHGHALEMIHTRQRLYLGEGMFRYFADAQAFDQKIEAAERALAISEKFELSEFADETRVAISYIRLAKAIWQIADQLANDRMNTRESQAKMRDHLAELDQACSANAESIQAWHKRHVAAAGAWERGNPDPFIEGGLKLWKWEEKMQAAVDNAHDLRKEINDWVTGRYLYLIKE